MLPDGTIIMWADPTVFAVFVAIAALFVGVCIGLNMAGGSEK